METVKSILEAKGSEVYSIDPEASLFDALEVMADKNIGAVLVIDAAGKVSGIFSERDFVRKFMIKGRSGEGTKVREIMTAQVLYVTPSTSLADCMNLMTEKRVRHLPVMLDGKPIGIVSIGDVVKAILKRQERVINEQASEIGQLERYISGCV
jgi:CBS domain-containing protein